MFATRYGDSGVVDWCVGPGWWILTAYANTVIGDYEMWDPQLSRLGREGRRYTLVFLSGSVYGPHIIRHTQGHGQYH